MSTLVCTWRSVSSDGAAELEAPPRQGIALALTLQRLARQRELFLIRHPCQVGVGDFRDQADLGCSPSFSSDKKLFECLAVEAAHAAEQIELERTDADAGTVLP